MSLTIKDLFTTILAIGTAGIAYATWKGLNLSLLSSHRVATLVLLIVGIAMCAYGSTIDPAKGYWSNPYVISMTVLGSIALVIGIIGLVTGAKTMVLALCATILILYLVSTIRHIVA